MSERGKGVHWVTDADGEMPVKADDAITVMKMLDNTCEKFGDRPAIRAKKDPSQSEWKTWTWNEYRHDIHVCARAMVSVGLEPFHGVCIIGFNSPEWFISDMGAIHAGGIAAGVYATNGVSACQHVALNCKAQLLFADDQTQMDKFLSVRDELDIKYFVCWESGFISKKEDNIYSWDDFMALGTEDHEEARTKSISHVNPGHCCTLIYTSGTTGPAKGVMISHDNFTFTANRGLTMVKDIGPTDFSISYLPLSHVAAQLVDIYAAMFTGACMYFAQPDALRGSLKKTLQEVRPTFFLGVPRVWEKFAEAMKEKGKQNSWLKKQISSWARGVGLRAGYAEQGVGSKPLFHGIAESLVFSKVKLQLGFDRCANFFTSAAPISVDTLEFFLSLGIPIYEIWGMSEGTGPDAVSVKGDYVTGFCGKALIDTELVIDNPDEDGKGELLLRGRHVCMGYLRNDEETDKVFDDQGFFHSGDVAVIDKKNGHLKIVGRIKEILVTAGGENVAPIPIENLLVKEIPIICHALVIGDGKKFLSCLLTVKSAPDKDALPTDQLSTSVLDVCASIGSTAKTLSDAQNCEKLQEYVQQGINRVNQQVISRAQKIQKFSILPNELSLQGNELTPTMKVKRGLVVKKYSDIIDRMYDV